MRHPTSPGKIGRPRPAPEPPATIRVARRFSAPPERVFHAWLDPAIAGCWLFATALRPIADVAIDARVGGGFRFADRRDGEITEHTGEYVEIVPHRRLVFSLSMGRHPGVTTRVVVAINPAKKGCELDLLHENVPLAEAHRTEARWTGMLYGLGATLDSLSRKQGRARPRPQALRDDAPVPTPVSPRAEGLRRARMPAVGEAPTND